MIIHVTIASFVVDSVKLIVTQIKLMIVNGMMRHFDFNIKSQTKFFILDQIALISFVDLRIKEMLSQEILSYFQS